MLLLYDITAVQVGNGARNFQNAVIGTGTQPQLVENRPEQNGSVVLQWTEFLEPAGRNDGVAGDAAAGKSFLLPCPGGLHPFPDVGGALGLRLCGEIVKGNRFYLNVQIKPIQKRAGNPVEILCNACGSEEKCKDENLALLTYMLQHNEHHAAELDEMADKLEKAGMADAAKQIREGVSDFQKGNMRLSLALTLVKEHLKEVK